jgi:hypothetical protein
MFLSVGYKHLTSLNFHACSIEFFSEQFFKYLSECKKLYRLNLASNKLTYLPQEIGLLKELKWLNLNENQLKELPSSMASLVNLVKLGVVKNQLRDFPRDIFIQMTKLEKLDVRENALETFPLSLLSLVPRDSIITDDIEAVIPHIVFKHLLHPPHLTTGGSLVSLLYDIHYHEDDTIDGIFYKSDDTVDSTQVTSMDGIFEILEDTPSFTSKELFEKSLLSKEPTENVRCCDQADCCHDVSQLTLPRETPFIRIESMKEYCIRSLLNQQTPDGKLFERLLPSHHVPSMLQQYVIDNAKTCSLCQLWYTESRYQVLYRVDLNLRTRIPIRIDVCSCDCAFEAFRQLYAQLGRWRGVPFFSCVRRNINVNTDIWGEQGTSQST